MSEKIENKIMDKIKDGRIKLKSKYIFWAEKLGLGTAFTLSVILSILFFNLILFYLKETDNLKYLSFGKFGIFAFLESFPYLLVIAFILLIILAGYLITKSDASYKKPFGQIIIVMISIIMFFGVILTFTNISNQIENYSRNMKERILLPFDNVRERGVSGIIYELYDDYLILQTPQGLRTVKFDKDYKLEVGQFIISVGETKQYDFFAKDIKIIKKEEIPAVGREINFKFESFNKNGNIPPELLLFNENEKECISDCMKSNDKKTDCFKECKDL